MFDFAKVPFFWETTSSRSAFKGLKLMVNNLV